MVVLMMELDFDAERDGKIVTEKAVAFHYIRIRLSKSGTVGANIRGRAYIRTFVVISGCCLCHLLKQISVS